MADDLVRSDAELATAVREALRRDADVQDDHVSVAAHDGWITLSGCADHIVQWSMADCTARYVPGLKGVTNALTIADRAAADRAPARADSHPCGSDRRAHRRGCS